MKTLHCIMLIDDNKLDNFFHKRVIAKYDDTIEVVEMLSATDALKYLTGGNVTKYPDIIFLDINMPGMNGWEFLEEYKSLSDEMRKSMIVIMLTTSENPNEKTRALNNSFLTDFISKPLDSGTLSGVVEKFSQNQ
jgi:CheY-like chemotaxis protein